MASMLRHRGPDGEGFKIFPNGLGLAHRRLKIVDLTDQACQPMATPDESLWLVFNGEIHNYQELREELAGRGARFRSASDTEVVLHAYAAWGRECFERFNGMWALALWDVCAGQLVLSRDRFGIKPLHVSIRGERLAFASEPKAILAAFPEERVVRADELQAYLSGAAPDATEATFFKNITALPSAVCVVYDRAGERRHSYWRFQPGTEAPRPDAEEEFRWLLSDAVRMRLRSDVPLGVALSGGLDSSSVARLAAAASGRPMDAFSLRYVAERECDESRFAQLVADDPARFRTHWIEPVPDGMVERLGRIVWHHDAPAPMRGRYPQWFVYEEASRHVRVILDGSGADELLGGYERFIAPYLLDRLRRLPGQSRPGMGLLREIRNLLYVTRPRLGVFLRLFASPLLRKAGVGVWPLPRVLHPDFAAAQARVPAARFFSTWLRRDVERPYRSHLNNALWNEFRYVGLPEELHGADALSMAFSLESRPPFLDHRLVEFCFGLAFDWKVGNGWTKTLLRSAMADVLPSEVAFRRDKMGFPAPVGKWLSRPANMAAVRAILLDRRCLDRGIFHARRLERALADFATRRGRGALYSPEPVWRWLNAELWFRLFLDEGVGAPA